MATNKFVEIDIEEARELADINGIINDFECAKSFSSQLIEMLSQNPPDYNLVEPMTTAVLVRYCRPFVSGVRRRITEDELSTLSTEQRQAHDMFYLWRNKHIAHSVNVFEENQPVARYWVERFEDEGFTSVECNSMQLTGMSIHNLKMIIELASHFIEELKPLKQSEKDKVLNIIRSLPKEKVIKMEKPTREPAMNDVAKVRS